MVKLKTGEELMQALTHLPPYQEGVEDAGERLLRLGDLYQIYIPSKMTVEIYNKLYMAMIQSIEKKTTRDAVIQRNLNYQRIENGIIGGSDSFTVIGNSGLGKSSAVFSSMRVLEAEKIIELEKPFMRVVPILTVQCPFDCSVKSLLIAILKSLEDKLGGDFLDKVLKMIPKKADPKLLVGFDHSDDAAVYQLTDELAVVQTLDFFPPMVEDPYLFGKIAATNALSDIYAMGGEVKTALNIVCFPESMDANILGQILLGGNEKVTEAGGVLAGGHSINDVDVKYGLSVMGTIHPKRILENNHCKEGDLLLLTKPLGVGIVMTASRMKAVSEEAFDQAVESMTTLNKYAAEIFKKYGIHACTDITGFGLLVHLGEMLGENFSAEVWTSQIPYIRACEDYVEEFYITAAGQRNRNHIGAQVAFENCSFAMEEILFDPQTSGGLLVAIPENEAKKALKEIEALGLDCGIIGRVTEKKEKKIYVLK